MVKNFDLRSWNSVFKVAILPWVVKLCHFNHFKYIMLTYILLDIPQWKGPS